LNIYIIVRYLIGYLKRITYLINEKIYRESLNNT